MFKDLRTSTKLALLCAMFTVTIAATTYSLVAEKQIAIDFAERELQGARLLVPARDTYATVLAAPPFVEAAPLSQQLSEDIVEALSATADNVGHSWQIDAPVRAVATALSQSFAAPPNSMVADELGLAVLDKTQQLVSRIADTSNLSLDPDLDTYYLQDLITRKLPDFIRWLGEVQIAYRNRSMQDDPADWLTVRAGLLRSAMNDVTRNLEAAYRDSPDGSLKASVDDAFARMRADFVAYLAAVSSPSNDPVDALFEAVATNTVNAWTTAQSELVERLLGRIDGFVDRRRSSLALIGVLVVLSIIVAITTHRQTVRPLERLEDVATAVGQSKNYDLRVDYSGTNEIGKLATTFNDMLRELAAARDREESERSELARAARLATMGEMSATIAHEINQPLAAIVANSKAADRWLSRIPPEIDEARSSLKNIAKDGHRASDVVSSVRAMFKTATSERTPVDINEVIEDVLGLLRGEFHRRNVRVESALSRGIPNIVADRVQLQQVVFNLISNAVEAMSETDRERVLRVVSKVDTSGEIVASVEDSGPGIDPFIIGRIFEPFFTTKSKGMGLGLSICRSIIEAHGGNLTAAPGKEQGTAFRIVLPSDQTGEA